MKQLAEIAFMLRIGKMKGKFEETKDWILSNNLYIKGIHSAMFVILKQLCTSLSFQLPLLGPDGNLPLS